MFKFRLLLGPDRMYIIKKQTQLKMEQIELNRNTELPTLYSNKNQHQELNRIKMKQTELK
jgi:hypothetical protein